jgi:hypothetical protein
MLYRYYQDCQGDKHYRVSSTQCITTEYRNRATVDRQASNIKVRYFLHPGTRQPECGKDCHHLLEIRMPGAEIKSIKVCRQRFSVTQEPTTNIDVAGMFGAIGKQSASMILKLNSDQGTDNK